MAAGCRSPGSTMLAGCVPLCAAARCRLPGACCVSQPASHHAFVLLIIVPRETVSTASELRVDAGEKRAAAPSPPSSLRTVATQQLASGHKHGIALHGRKDTITLLTGDKVAEDTC